MSTEYEFPKYVCFSCVLATDDAKIPGMCDMKEGKCDVCGLIKDAVVEAKDFGYPTFKKKEGA